ncbi:uncharacterized protein LOC117526182 [Thalassophryne amazonica]|uniref:uncharacterized protein LOC117526182 n=1 Tax=Thalassophryne amazonica TaxID=390379 RepID=UPI001471F7A6|nr:uncharacterized protein LOC117526182 [Thalassophryne amazonica]
MAIQIHGQQEEDIPVLGVIMNGDWAPLVSVECAFRIGSQPQELVFFATFSAPCITFGDGIHLRLILHNQEYTLSCPDDVQFPYIPSPPVFTSSNHFPYFLHDVHAPAPLPQPLTQDYFAHHVFAYPQPHQLYPVGVRPVFPQLSPDTPSGPPSQHFPYFTGPAMLRYYPSEHPNYPSPPYQPPYVVQAPYTPKPSREQTHTLHQVLKLPIGPAQYPGNVHFPTHPDSPELYSPGNFYPYGPIFFPPPPQKEPRQPPGKSHLPTPLAICSPHTHTVCSYYPYQYYPTLYQSHPFYHPVAMHPETKPTTATKRPSTPISSAAPPRTPPLSHFTQCLMGRIMVFLPFAYPHPEFIQVKDQNAWIPISSVSPLCGYVLEMVENFPLILHSPMPACHSHLKTSSTISFPLRVWDLYSGQYKILDLECHHQNVPEAPVVSTPIKGQLSSEPGVFCSSHQMTVELPQASMSGIVLKDIAGNWIRLQDAPKHCYSASKGEDGKILLHLPLQSQCHMTIQDQMYQISVVYMTESGTKEASLSCPITIPRYDQECNLPDDHRLPCGLSYITQEQCLSMGCCFGTHTPACYYPMDECTIDRHFVFSVPASLTEPPLSPTLLVAAGNSTCKPQKVTAEYALFKIPMNDCGVRRLEVGKTVIYMLEIINMLQAISLNYGTITRDYPVRLLVECRYLPSDVQTVSYLVKTPTLGAAIHTQGVFGVQLRIAKDAQYSSYYPQYHQPLEMLLGKPLYLEVRLLNSPDPSWVLLVHFCVAYPRSGNAVWVILYNGCPNLLDPATDQSVLPDPPLPVPQAQVRRFTIKTFMFLPDGEVTDPSEEIYFMCSTEICSPHDGPCVEGCFGR